MTWSAPAHQLMKGLHAQMLGGARVCFGPGSFAQANYGAMDAALAAMQPFVPQGATLVDMHAGVGVIGAALLSCSLVLTLFP